MERWKLHTKFFKHSINRYRSVALYIFVLVIMITACSPKVSHSVLTFMFDGVPDKTFKDSSVAAKVVRKDTMKIDTRVVVLATNPEMYYHQPYKERACSKCHDTEVPDKMPVSQDAVCYTCHTNYQTTNAYVHGPVESGFCTACHAPHFSKYKKLLTRDGQDICLNCHNRADVMENKEHAGIANRACTECHNPHASNDHFFVKLNRP